MRAKIVLSAGRYGWVVLLSVLISAGLAAETTAQTPRSETTYKLMPRGDLYKPYIADPQRVTFSAQLSKVFDENISSTGASRALLQAGGRFGIVRLHPADDLKLGWQISFEAGADFLFDPDHSSDNIAWDGNFGWYLTHAIENGWSFKLDALHTSSHLGDEYMENTGMTRINYTRREIALGVSKQFNPNYRIYGDGAVGYDPGDPDLQEPGRFQAGFEIEYPKSMWQGAFGWYAATDLQTWQERDWKLDASLQTGLFVTSDERTVRIGIALSRGRPTVQQFFQVTESQVLFGIWVDI
jgi:hypothetical protein